MLSKLKYLQHPVAVMGLHETCRKQTYKRQHVSWVLRTRTLEPCPARQIFFTVICKRKLFSRAPLRTPPVPI